MSTYRSANDYREHAKWERKYGIPTYVYDRDVAQRNWAKIQENIAHGRRAPKMVFDEDGYEVPYGDDCFYEYGELMPDGVIDKNSIFYRDNKNGEFPWMGNYYSLKTIGYIGKDVEMTPLNAYDKEIDENLRLLREFGTPMNSGFSRDNKNGL